jgi:hypothetical protein
MFEKYSTFNIFLIWIKFKKKYNLIIHKNLENLFGTF